MTELYRKCGECGGTGFVNGPHLQTRNCGVCERSGFVRDHEAEAKIARLDGAVDVWVVKEVNTCNPPELCMTAEHATSRHEALEIAGGHNVQTIHATLILHEETK